MQECFFQLQLTPSQYAADINTVGATGLTVSTTPQSMVGAAQPSSELWFIWQLFSSSLCPCFREMTLCTSEVEMRKPTYDVLILLIYNRQFSHLRNNMEEERTFGMIHSSLRAMSSSSCLDKRDSELLSPILLIRLAMFPATLT